MTIFVFRHMVRYMKTVYRTEIAECVEEAFRGSPMSSTDLVEFAADHGARTPVLKVLARLHGLAYRELRELWSELGDIPVDR